MLIERAGHSPNRFIVLEVQLPFAAALVLPSCPSAVQGVLQNRELVRVVAYIIDEPRQQYGTDVRAAYSHRSTDGRPTFLASQTWHQVLPFVDGLGQASK